MNKINTNNDKGIDAILQGIDILIAERHKQSNFDRTLSGVVTQADYETNTYSVKINEYVYQDIPSTIRVNVNDSVLVNCPQNQTSQMFICNRIDTTNYLTKDEGEEYNTDTTIQVNDDTKGILVEDNILTLQLESGCIYMLYGASYDIETGAIVYKSIHVIYTSLLDEDIPTLTKLNGTENTPYTLHTIANQCITLTNLGTAYNSHFALKKIF